MKKNIWEKVTQTAQKYGLTKREIIESSVEQHLFKLKQKEYEDGFKNFANDKDMLEMAEWGIGDYYDQLEKL